MKKSSKGNNSSVNDNSSDSSSIQQKNELDILNQKMAKCNSEINNLKHKVQSNYFNIN
jgi:hypothetical protein